MAMEEKESRSAASGASPDSSPTTMVNGGPSASATKSRGQRSTPAALLSVDEAFGPCETQTDRQTGLCKILFSKMSAANDVISSGSGGAYGENRASSVRALLDIARDKYCLTQNSVFLDVGSGRGVPSFVASAYTQRGASLGVEIDENAATLSQKNLVQLLEAMQQRQVESGIDPYEHAPPLHCGFLHADACDLESFDPATHVYSFDFAMPAFMIARFVKLFNSSHTAFIYMSFRKDLVSVHGLRGCLMESLQLSMAGSGEKHLCYIYGKGAKSSTSAIKPTNTKYSVPYRLPRRSGQRNMSAAV